MMVSFVKHGANLRFNNSILILFFTFKKEMKFI